MYSETKVGHAGLGVEEGRGASRCLDLGLVELVVVLIFVHRSGVFMGVELNPSPLAVNCQLMSSSCTVGNLDPLILTSRSRGARVLSVWWRSFDTKRRVERFALAICKTKRKGTGGVQRTDHFGGVYQIDSRPSLADCCMLTGLDLNGVFCILSSATS